VKVKMHDHKRCPECDSLDTSVEWTEWYNDHVERIRICNDCPTQWTVNYGDPRVSEVEKYD